ncbi:hypothetical protein Marpi_1588 [Marinitoga piezophila KA3]|uniref:ATP synthase I chain n=2 Tax=Petrotogaceae TaxID=1643949 RepID=H2J4N6_MARPK|nr:hypothetical protein Marpi_1588 [Marinitoga piezophila KA3]
MKEIAIKIGILSLGEVVILFVFFGLKSLWIFWGSFGAVIGILMIVEDIKKIVTNGKQKFPKGYIIRYIFFGIILLVGALFSEVGLFLTFLGLLNMKIAALLSPK